MNLLKERIRKPDWLKVQLGNNRQFSVTGKLVSSGNLHTICQSGRCPNLGECWNQGAATFMIGGDICTRSCKFCNTKTGKPLPLDADEPVKVAQSIRELGLRHAVITSVDRDDLPDAGAGHWVETLLQVKAYNPKITIEALIPDFGGNTDNIAGIIATAPEIITHNLETVRRLTPFVRSVARYERSLAVLKQISESKAFAKTGLMLGLGETEKEVYELMDDVLSAGCFFLSIGQYLQPSRKHLPVREYIHPEMFVKYKDKAYSSGFRHVESGPLVRSSYRSANYLL